MSSVSAIIDALTNARNAQRDLGSLVNDYVVAAEAHKKRIAELEKENAGLREKLFAAAVTAAETPSTDASSNEKRIANLEKQNEKLRTCWRRAAAWSKEAEDAIAAEGSVANTIEETTKGAIGRTTSYKYTPPPGDLGERCLFLNVMGAASSDEALLNEAYINLGTPFEGHKYLRPIVPIVQADPNIPEYVPPAGVCIRARCDSTMAQGHIRMPMYHRLDHRLDIGKTYEFIEVECPPPAKSCAIKVTPITAGAPPADVFSGRLKQSLWEAILFDDSNLVVHLGMHTYRVTVKSVSPAVACMSPDTRVEPFVELLRPIV